MREENISWFDWRPVNTSAVDAVLPVPDGSLEVMQVFFLAHNDMLPKEGRI